VERLAGAHGTFRFHGTQFEKSPLLAAKEAYSHCRVESKTFSRTRSTYQDIFKEFFA